MSFKMLDNVTAIKASLPVKSAIGTSAHTVEIILDPTLASTVSVVQVKLQGGYERVTTCVNTSAGLADGSTAQRVNNGSLFYYVIDGVSYSLAAGTAGTVITDPIGTAITGTITGSKYGGVNIYVNSAGTIRCRGPIGFGLTGVQAYDDAATCLAALALVPDPSGYCLIGRVTIAAAGGGFTFGTTALTGVSTYYNAQCPYYDITTYNMTSGDLTAQRASFTTIDVHANYIRTFLSALTGSGVTVIYTPLEK